MAVLQKKSMSFSLMGPLAASCLLLIALWAHEAVGLPITSHCKLDVSNFQRPYFTNRTFKLAEEASLADNNTDVRLIGDELFQGVNRQNRCYLMKQVLNFTLAEVLIPHSDRFQPYMQQVVPFLTKLSNQLSLCQIRGDGQHIQKNIQTLKETVKQLGESGEIKAIGELNLLFMHLRNYCV
ncbi:interleukin-22 [Mesocricetus auratus]|uniref:Interleukin-22 n=1 Tax=Mesocricetus auratus TaxID=10036 RepID=A0A1U7R863_MESAU|nr:interleukin-22 [Mesocricetus auratus]